MALEFIWMGQYFLNLADHRAQRKAERESALAVVGKRRRDAMKCRRRLLAVIFVISFIGVAYGELKLQPIHPDEPVEYTYEKRFSLEMALSSLRKIQASLGSFRTLTDEAKGKISGERLKEIGVARGTSTETINGYVCQKRQWETKGQPPMTLTEWASKKLGFVIKTQMKAPWGTKVIEYKNIKVGKVPDSLFEVPKGYKQAPTPPMPKLPQRR